MSALSELLSGPIGQALGWSLVHVTWQGLLVAIALAAALASSRDSRVRYGYCVGALALLVLAPAITFMVSLDAATAAEAAVSVAADGAGTLPGNAPPGGWPLRVPADAPSPTAPASPPWLATLTGLWLAGVAAFATRVALQWLRARQLVSQGVRPAGADLERQLSALLSRLKLTRNVRVMLSTRVDVPLVVGWLAPVVLLPLGATDVLSPAQVRAVLAHELAHVKRLDGLVNLIQALVEALLFFHPAAWWVSARLRVEREFCCDDVAVAASGSALEYAKALATLDALRPDHPEGTGLVPATLSSHGGSLMDRIARLAGRSPARPPRRLLPGATLLLVSALSATGMAFATPVGDDCLAERLDGVQLATGEDGCQLVFARSGNGWDVRCVDEDCADVVTVDVHESAGSDHVDALVTGANGEYVRLALEGMGQDESAEDDLLTYEVITGDGEQNLVIVTRRGEVETPLMVTRKPREAGRESGVVGGYRVKLDDSHHEAIRDELHKARTMIRLDRLPAGHGDAKAKTKTKTKVKSEKVKAKVKLKAEGDYDLEEAVQVALEQAGEHGAGAGIYVVEIVDDSGNTQVVEVHATDEPAHEGHDDHGDHHEHDGDGHDGDHGGIVRHTVRGSADGHVLRIGPELFELDGDEGGLLDVFRFDNDGQLLQHDRHGADGGHFDLQHEDGHFGFTFKPNEFVELEELPGDARQFFVSLGDDEDETDSIVTWLGNGDDHEVHIDDETGAWFELDIEDFEAEDGSLFQIDTNVFFGDDEEHDGAVFWTDDEGGVWSTGEDVECEAGDAGSANVWFTTAFGDDGGVWVTHGGDEAEVHDLWFSGDDEADEGHDFWVTRSGDEHEVHDFWVSGDDEEADVWVTDSGENIIFGDDVEGVWVTDGGENIVFGGDDGAASVWLSDLGGNIFSTEDGDESCEGCGDSCESECDIEVEDEGMTWRRVFVGSDDEAADEAEEEDEGMTWRRVFVGSDDEAEHEVHETHDRFTVRGRVLDHEGHEVRDAQVRYKLRTDDGVHDVPRAVQRYVLRGGQQFQLPESNVRLPRRIQRTDVAPRIMRWRGGHELPGTIRSRIGTRREAPQGLSWRVHRGDEDDAREVEVHVELRGEDGAEVERRIMRLPAPAEGHEDGKGVMRWRYEIEPSGHVVPATELPADEQPEIEVVDVEGVVAT